MAGHERRGKGFLESKCRKSQKTNGGATVKIWYKIINWIILKLAGRRTIVINAEIRGSLTIKTKNSFCAYSLFLPHTKYFDYAIGYFNQYGNVPINPKDLKIGEGNEPKRNTHNRRKKAKNIR